jgi:single-strand DNA-binding protein
MLGLNHVQIIGNLGAAPELRYLNDTDQVVNFPVAVNERWKNRNGEPQKKTTWLRVVAYNGVGQACAEYLRTGDGIYIEGRLQIREYEDKGGNRRTSVEVVASRVRFLSHASTADEKRPTPGKPRERTAAARLPEDTGKGEDVPF